MSYDYTITSKGQITLPKKLRDTVGLKTGSHANISLLDNRTIIIRAPLGIEEIRKKIGAPANDQPLTKKESSRLKARGL
ncbi:hypothetical protein A3F37_03755 [Candidatus Saccharibacteria bacterium RIFCSPHIGHO2_12_FULL_41_12]|nr:MAG: hypothetical protein A3F37_03755 [Candidatus Saccharibacteria bacterium RIFCSPHIGHO2_12_FULL_41_12]